MFYIIFKKLNICYSYLFIRQNFIINIYTTKVKQVNSLRQTIGLLTEWMKCGPKIYLDSMAVEIARWTGSNWLRFSIISVKFGLSPGYAFQVYCIRVPLKIIDDSVLWK